MYRHATLVLVLALVVECFAAEKPAPRPRAAAARTPSTLKLLNQRLPEVRFSEQPLDQVLDWLAEFTHVSFVVRWQVLQDAGLKKDKVISIQARDLRLAQVLWLVMSEAGGADLILAYRASGNMIVLSTAEDLGKEVVTKVYDVGDLLVRPPQAGLPNYQQSQGLQAGGSGGSGGGGGGNIFGQGQNQQNNQQQNLSANGRPVQLDNLIRLIYTTVEPDTWKANGGQIGSIETFGNLLIVRNNILAHQQLGGYLTDDELIKQ